MKSDLAVIDKVCCVSTRADQKLRMKAVGLAVIRMKAVVLEMVYWMSSCVYRSRGGWLMHTCMQALIIYRIRLNNHRIKDFIIHTWNWLEDLLGCRFIWAGPFPASLLDQSPQHPLILSGWASNE